MLSVALTLHINCKKSAIRKSKYFETRIKLISIIIFRQAKPLQNPKITANKAGKNTKAQYSGYLIIVTYFTDV